MTKYEPIDICEELKFVNERMTQLLQLVNEDLVLIRLPELNNHIKQIRLNLTEIRRTVMRHTPKEAREAMMERLKEYRRLNPKYAETDTEPGQTRDQD